MSEILRIKVKRLNDKAIIPRYSYTADAGLDLYSCEDLVLQPFERALIPIGFAIEIPEGYAGFVQPRSGLAIKKGLSLVNTPGLIDSHYRGELKVIAINLDAHTPIQLHAGDRIAQLVIQRVAAVELIETEELSQTDRNQGGFGSSGV
ncbi:MAG: dUTP diphosphatase [Coriobacteriia bacterium]|nr:dUTP diphosphatase [Coriobacteriia bacterium]